MRHITLLLALCFFTAIYAAEPDSIDQQWVEDHYTKREVMIPMRDGVKLFTAIYEPKDNSKPHPILMNRQCYGCAPYGPGQFNRFANIGYREYIRNGYIIVYQDVRGKNKSEGTFEDLRPYIPNKKGKTQVDEASDTYDTAEWLIHNTHSNNKIGVHGISYPGFYATMAALSLHPAIKAVTPQAPVTDWFRGDDDHHNGALCLMDMFSFEYWFKYINTPDFWAGRRGRNEGNPTDIVSHDVYTDYLRIGAVKNFTKITGDSLDMWNHAVNHPNQDDWWYTHTVTNYVQYLSSSKKANPAVMVIGGLYDAEDCFGAFATYKAIKEKSPKTPVYLVEGPWSHGAWRYSEAQSLGGIDYGKLASEEYYMHNIEYPFFAYYLEGKGEKPEYGAQIFDSGARKWYKIKEGWDPKAETFTSGIKTKARKRTAFELQADGALCSDVTYCPKSPGTGAEYTQYVSDPSRPVPYIGVEPHYSRTADYMNADQRFASWRPDVAVFQTDTLTRPLAIVGTPEVDFTVSASTTDADFIVKVIDVDKDGRQTLIRWEVMRGKFRNSFSNPEPFVPNQPTALKFELNDMSHTFLPGHRLMIQVQSTLFPIIDRNPQKFCNIYTCDDADFQSSTIRIYHTGEHQSKIWLPVVENQK